LLTGDRLGVSHSFFSQQAARPERGTLMNIKLPTRLRDEFRRSRRAARLSAVLAVLGVPALLSVTLAGTASASTAFSAHLTPNNTFFLVLDVSGAST
jgi:hypothetical protein